MARFAELFDLFVLDLDGTLADTLHDLARSVNHALAALGRPPLPIPTVAAYVGNGARRLLERSLGEAAPAADLSRALAVFLEHYAGACLVETRLYPGVRQTLEALRPRQLAVLTNKPLGPTRAILRGLGIDGLFARVIGGDSGPPKKPDPQGLASILTDLAVSPGRAILVGDSAIDVETARRGGVSAALVTYGFQAEEGRSARPDYILAAFDELLGEAIGQDGA